MTRENYAAWELGEDLLLPEEATDGEKLRHFARFAILSPSAHNTQPWRFRFHPDRLDLEVASAAALDYSGPGAGEPHVSLGACLETLVLAARGYGYDLKLDQTASDSQVATATILGRIDAEPALLEAIRQRTSNRSPFGPESLPTDLASYLSTKGLAGASLCLIDDPGNIGFVADLTVRGTASIMSPPAFRAELSAWVRNNLTRRYDGMPGFVQGMPLPPSLLAKHIIRHINISKAQAKKDGELVRQSAILALILAHSTSDDAYLDAGRLYARTCILAGVHGFASSGVAAAVIDPETREELIDRLNLTSRPCALVRLGRPTKAARHTPRFPLSRVTLPT